MTYIKHTWVTGEIITAEKLNHMEDGITGSGGTGLSDEAKQALLACFEHVAWTDEQGQDYYDALEAALNPPADLVSISAVYTQSGTVYDNDSLDDLKADLVVTATYDDSTTEVVTTYTLSGTLAEGTSTITVSYGGKTTTFTVTVSEEPTPSYVTDGLIHRWDGIDNTSNGHDSSATSWEDLVGNYDLEIVDNTKTTWNADSMSFSAGYIRSATDSIESPVDKTIEVVFKTTDNSTTQTVAQPFYLSTASAKAYGKVTIYADNTVGAKGESGKTYGTGLSGITAINSVSATMTSTPSVNKVFVNGSEVSVGSTSHSMQYSFNRMIVGGSKQSDNQTLGYTFTGKIYAIRIYNRNLTDAEIAQNYAVDCDRFSLT